MLHRPGNQEIGMILAAIYVQFGNIHYAAVGQDIRRSKAGAIRKVKKG